ncbi:hypothetical protein [Nonomuraea rosea]
MPRRGDGPPQRDPQRDPQGGPQGGPQGEPFETTGAFALPNDSTGGSMPPGDTGHGAFPQDRMGEPAGPFETTGAFARPSEWDQPPGQPNPGGPRGPFDPAGPGQQGGSGGPVPFAGPPERSPFFEGQEDNSGPFAVQPGGPGPFNGPPAGPGPFDSQPGGPGPFGGPPGGQGPFDGPPGGPGAFDGQPGHPGAFGGQPGGPGPFEGPPGHPGGFDGRPERPGPFDAPAGGPFDGPPSGPFDGPADRTARFDVPSGPNPMYVGPPEPGDIKVAGEPTAIHNTPAWASAETGFLDSGWSSDSGIDDEPDEPKSRRGRRKSPRNDELLAAAPASAGKGRVALLSVAAVAVVLGGTVAGVKLMSSPEGPAKCTGTSCAAVQASGPPSADAADPAADVPEEEPEEEPSDDTESASTPTPTTTYAARTPRRSATPTPTPTKTKVKQSAKPTKEPTTPPPVEESVSETPTQETSTLDDDDTGVVPTMPSTANPTSTGTMGSGNAGGQSVSVQQTIKQRLTSYAATLQLSNTSTETVADPTVSLPVDGQVMNVTGAEWTQDGDLLILDLSADLAAGTSVDVTFTATGKGSKAENCGMVTGECSVT